MENITLEDIYRELKSLSKKMERMETLIVPEEKIGKAEELEIRALSEEAKRELKEGKAHKLC